MIKIAQQRVITITKALEEVGAERDITVVDTLAPDPRMIGNTVEERTHERTIDIADTIPEIESIEDALSQEKRRKPNFLKRDPKISSREHSRSKGPRLKQSPRAPCSLLKPVVSISPPSNFDK